MRRVITDQVGDRCTAAIELRDRSHAQCGRRAKSGSIYCWQHEADISSAERGEIVLEITKHATTLMDTAVQADTFVESNMLKYDARKALGIARRVAMRQDDHARQFVEALDTVAREDLVSGCPKFAKQFDL